MFKAEVYSKRRNALRKSMSNGLIVFLGNNEAPANYPDNAYHFRQDSSFLYFFGHNLAGLAAIIDLDNDEEYLVGDDFSMDDIIWMGVQPSIQELAHQVGISHSMNKKQFASTLKDAISKGRKIHYLPPYRFDNKLYLEELLGIKAAELNEHKSIELIKAIVNLRLIKENIEIEEMEHACDIGYDMHTTAMRMCKAGVLEQHIAGAIEGIALAQGSGVSFATILTQHGETMHNHVHDKLLEKGKLMLTDAGAEANSNYCSDFTRTIPVGGKYSSRQRDIYSIVAGCHNHTIEIARPGIPWLDVHNAVCKQMIEGLKALGLMKGNADEAVAAGAQYLFMPHGLGHAIGLDVHDMEDLGQEYVGYDDEFRPSKQFGLASLRMGKRLQEGFVMSDEPGCYFIPALIDKWKAENINAEFLNFDVIEKYKDFGGIRLEDDVLITADGARFMGHKHIPVSIEEVENFMNE